MSQSSSSCAVFTGAGISGALPAGLPMGNALRDSLLRLMHAQAAAFAADLVPAARLDDFLRSSHKLEVVLGRLAGVLGRDAVDCLFCLRVPWPNRAHMLAALHLAAGGTHATLNFDRGIEQAYLLLRGEATHALPAQLDAALAAWQARASTAPPLRVVASKAEFDDWLGAGRPSALLKLHGSLTADEQGLIDVVVEDHEELGQLAPGRATALASLGEKDALLITGYAGADSDIYRPLLAAASPGSATWACLSLPADSPVPEDCCARGIDLKLGQPQGLADRCLEQLMDAADLKWPEVQSGAARWTDAFEAWQHRMCRDHEPVMFATAWAWLLADTGQADEGEPMLARVHSLHPSPVATVRWADLLYDRARTSDHDHARLLYRSLIGNPSVAWPFQAHCMLRVGRINRGNAVRSQQLESAAALRALAAPLVVAAKQVKQRRDPETSAAACAVLGQTALRFAEFLILGGQRPRKLTALALLNVAGITCRLSARLTLNGNRRALVRTHGLQAVAWKAFLTSRPASSDAVERLKTLEPSYHHLSDWPGAGNCAAALATLSLSDGAFQDFQVHHDRAREHYGHGRRAGELLPSGAALLARIESARAKSAC